MKASASTSKSKEFKSSHRTNSNVNGYRSMDSVKTSHVAGKDNGQIVMGNSNGRIRAHDCRPGLILALRGFPIDNSQRLTKDLIHKSFFPLSCFGYATNLEGTYYFLYFRRNDVLRDIKQFFKLDASRPHVQQAVDHFEARNGANAARFKDDDPTLKRESDGTLIQLQDLVFLIDKAKRQDGTPSIWFSQEEESKVKQARDEQEQRRQQMITNATTAQSTIEAGKGITKVAHVNPNVAAGNGFCVPLIPISQQPLMNMSIMAAYSQHVSPTTISMNTSPMPPPGAEAAVDSYQSKLSLNAEPWPAGNITELDSQKRTIPQDEADSVKVPNAGDNIAARAEEALSQAAETRSKLQEMLEAVKQNYVNGYPMAYLTQGQPAFQQAAYLYPCYPAPMYPCMGDPYQQYQNFYMNVFGGPTMSMDYGQNQQQQAPIFYQAPLVNLQNGSFFSSLPAQMQQQSLHQPQNKKQSSSEENAQEYSDGMLSTSSVSNSHIASRVDAEAGDANGGKILVKERNHIHQQHFIRQDNGQAENESVPRRQNQRMPMKKVEVKTILKKMIDVTDETKTAARSILKPTSNILNWAADSEDSIDSSHVRNIVSISTTLAMDHNKDPTSDSNNSHGNTEWRDRVRRPGPKMYAIHNTAAPGTSSGSIKNIKSIETRSTESGETKKDNYLKPNQYRKNNNWRGQKSTSKEDAMSHLKDTANERTENETASTTIEPTRR